MDETVWRSLTDISGKDVSITTQANGLYSVRFASRYKYYKYTVTTTESITYVPYLVDSSFDRLIIWKAISSLMFPYIDAATTARDIYNEALDNYATLFNTNAFDYDLNEDGAIANAEKDTKKRTVLYR